MSMSSHKCEVKRALDGLRLQEPRPGFHRLAYRAGTTARASLVRQAAAHERVPAPHDSIFQPIVHQVVERAEEQPHTAHDVQDVAKANGQDRDLPVGRPRAFGRQQRARQHQGSDFLGTGFHGVTLQQVGSAELPLDLPEIQFVLPAAGIQFGQFARRGGGGIPQTGPQAELVRAMAGAPHVHPNFAQLEPGDNPGRMVPRAHGYADEPTAIAQALDQAGLVDREARSNT